MLGKEKNLFVKGVKEKFQYMQKDYVQAVTILFFILRELKDGVILNTTILIWNYIRKRQKNVLFVGLIRL